MRHTRVEETHFGHKNDDRRFRITEIFPTTNVNLTPVYIFKNWIEHDTLEERKTYDVEKIMHNFNISKHKATILRKMLDDLDNSIIDTKKPSTILASYYAHRNS